MFIIIIFIIKLFNLIHVFSDAYKNYNVIINLKN